MGQSQTRCLYFGNFLNSNWQTYVWKLSLPLLGFELRIPGVGSDCSAYCLVRQNHIRLQRWHNRRIIRWLYVGLQQLKFMNVSNNLHPTKNIYCCQNLSIINSFLSYTIKAELHNRDMQFLKVWGFAKLGSNSFGDNLRTSRQTLSHLGQL